MDDSHPIDASSGIVGRLAAAGSAEEFFMTLGLKYDGRVLDVARLHILKRMGEYLAAEDFEGVTDAVVADRCRAMLERAYVDFVSSSPLDHRVFKVLKKAAAPRRPTFVPLEALLKKL